MEEKTIEQDKIHECSCTKCQDLCKKNPGWFAPEEARAAIEAGYASKMMRDWLDPSTQLGNDEQIFILSPASEDCGGRDAPEWEEMCARAGVELDSFFEAMMAISSPNPPCKGVCEMQDPDTGLCELHDTGFKPLQCRSALACNSAKEEETMVDNYDMARKWDTDEGREVVKLWQDTLAAEQ